MDLTLATELSTFPGVGPTRAKALARLGLTDVESLLAYFPRSYEDRSQVCALAKAPEGEKVCVSVLVAESPRTSYIRSGLSLTKCRIVDGTAAADVTFFNQDYVRQALERGVEYTFYGEVERKNSHLQMTNPVFERSDKARFTGRIMPVYPLTAGVSNNLLAGLCLPGVEQCAGAMPETLPVSVREGHKLAAAEFAYQNIHFPVDQDALAVAKRRMVFEELFTLSCGLTLLHRRRVGTKGLKFKKKPLKDFLSLLPFAPTGAQKRAMEETLADVCSGEPMNRLVQGDVGSGKTAVAAFAAWLAVQNGYQSAMMAPTEILARQHLKTMTELLVPAGLRVGLLTGSMKAAEKRKVKARLAAGELDLVVGTHALLSEGVAFKALGLVITDEQHRFGVAQRAALAEKAVIQPHVLVMSATPIPRTLALIIYGDLDVTVIDELPPGRMPVDTFLVGEDKRERMYNFVRKQVANGNQTYIICPAVEEGVGGLKAVNAYAKELQEQIFPDLRVGLVHGKLKAAQKEAVMTAFTNNELDVLVSTTVVEVGVDVPNATLMVIENAERFGLSQLHQLRGRVGRGKDQSYCVLLTQNRSPETLERLKFFAKTTDGFKIAEKDLELRGPGNFFGQQQHGLPQLRAADLAWDTRALKEAQTAAEELIGEDPELEKPENQPLFQRVRRLFTDHSEIFN